MRAIKTVGLFGRFHDDRVGDSLAALRKLLEKNNLRVLLGGATSSTIAGARAADHNRPIGEMIDLAIVVGGDGTMLGAARDLAEHSIPTIGVNLGRLGFLADLAMPDLEAGISAILRGDYRLEQRTMLDTRVCRGEKVAHRGVSVNDAVIAKGDTGRLIEFDIHVNGQFLSQIRSDGIIVATPTGSTAYSLSAGGPIIYPTLPVFSLSPICPHTLSNRPIVLDQSSEIQITSMVFAEAHANLSLDGVLACDLRGDETILITRAAVSLPMIRIKRHNHFETLRSKLGWNE